MKLMGIDYLAGKHAKDFYEIIMQTNAALVEPLARRCRTKAAAQH